MLARTIAPHSLGSLGQQRKPSVACPSLLASSTPSSIPLVACSPGGASASTSTSSSNSNKAQWRSGRAWPRISSRPRLALCRAERSTSQLGGLDPLLEAAVPKDQRPANELTSLKQTALFSWAMLDYAQYGQRLAGIFGFFFAFIGGPIAYQTFDPSQQPLEFVLSASTGSLVIVAIVVIRIYLGWSYVGNRLMSAAVPYEETGWYDGQVFVKPPEVLTRDRLLGMYECKPVLQKLKATLLVSGGTLLTCALLLFGLIKAGSDQDGMYGRGAGRPAPRQVFADGILFTDKAKSLAQLMDDDEAAAAEAAATNGMPAYCLDRFYRARSGGLGCE